MLIIVNYHYIRDVEDSVPPGIHGINMHRFSKQIDFLGSNFNIIKPEDVSADVISSVEKHVLVTFDDGLKEQFTIARDLLIQNRIKALYFINGQNIIERKVSDVHRIHMLLSKLGFEELIRLISLKNTYKYKSYLQFKEEFRSSQNLYDGNNIRALKFYLNHFLPSFISFEIIDNIFKDHFNEENEVSRLYMNIDDLRSLSLAKELGSHGYGHYNHKHLTSRQLVKNIKNNESFFKNNKFWYSKIYSLPYGSRDAYDSNVLDKLISFGYRFICTTDRGFNSDTLTPVLKRFDTNDINFGKTSTIDLTNI